MLEEYWPNIKYIKGTDNDAADALTRIPFISYDKTRLPGSCCVEKLDSDMFPLINQRIEKYQWKDNELAAIKKRAK